jgi:hypothetical protein
MALIKCKECQSEISSKATSCPKCGAPVKKPTTLLIWLIAAVPVLIILGNMANSTLPKSSKVDEINTARTNENETANSNESISDKTIIPKEELKKLVPEKSKNVHFNELQAQWECAIEQDVNVASLELYIQNYAINSETRNKDIEKNISELLKQKYPFLPFSENTDSPIGFTARFNLVALPAYREIDLASAQTKKTYLNCVGNMLALGSLNPYIDWDKIDWKTLKSPYNS